MSVSATAADTGSKPGPLASILWRGLDLFVTFVLQVLGGAGAVWGCSEWASVRAGPNNNNWRVISFLVGLVCLARWCSIQFTSDRRLDGALASFLLQVLGAAGAIWGMCEILGSRVNYPSETRPNSRSPFGWRPAVGSDSLKECHGLQSYDGQSQAAGPQAAGMFEGPGESWSPGYESCNNTYTEWRVICAVVFLLFLARWNRLVPKGAVGRALDLHAATFVLDVCGGAGAVWGYSEILTLRLGWGDIYFGQPSFDIWRCVCAPFFLVCLFAWAADWRSREERAIQQEQAEQTGSQKDAVDGGEMDTITITI